MQVKYILVTKVPITHHKYFVTFTKGITKNIISNIRITGDSEREEKANGVVEICIKIQWLRIFTNYDRILTHQFIKLYKPSKINTNITLRHTIVKLLKIKTKRKS